MCYLVVLSKAFGGERSRADVAVNCGGIDLEFIRQLFNGVEDKTPELRWHFDLQ